MKYSEKEIQRNLKIVDTIKISDTVENKIVLGGKIIKIHKYEIYMAR